MQQDPLDAFIASAAQALAKAAGCRLVLSRPRPPAGDLTRVTARPLTLKGVTCVSFVYTHVTRDVTKNLAPADAMVLLRTLAADAFANGHLFVGDEEIELLTSKKGRRSLLRRRRRLPANGSAPARLADDGVEGKGIEVGGDGADERTADPTATPAPGNRHDRAKQRIVDVRRPFLTALGVTDAQHRVVPAMARKWKQINKFVEVLDHALAASPLAFRAVPERAPERMPETRPGTLLDVVDFGSGKGYLTFATHDHLRRALGLDARVAGVELRADMVAFCNQAAERLALEELRFEQGDVRSVVPPKIDIMIALHACDTATDHAIHTGLRAGASIIMCSPCCHKELRPQLLSPHPLRPVLKHGVHLCQQAEMLTDSLRAMLLDACGYDTQVFEFVALEHTQKNKMILAVKRAASDAGQVQAQAATVWQQVDELKSFYGIQAQCLEVLLRADRPDVADALAA